MTPDRDALAQQRHAEWSEGRAARDAAPVRDSAESALAGPATWIGRRVERPRGPAPSRRAASGRALTRRTGMRSVMGDQPR